MGGASVPPCDTRHICRSNTAIVTPSFGAGVCLEIDRMQPTSTP